jgi:predicted RNA-binding protein YlqC (UPF0109 family)
MSAVLSPRYSVQQYVIKEYLLNPISISIQYESDAQMVNKQLFVKGSDFGKTLSMAIKKRELL